MGNLFDFFIKPLKDSQQKWSISVYKTCMTAPLACILSLIILKIKYFL